jgi:Na+-transporting NADH:ubiquinone oxidoreductase subunit A
MRFLSPVAGTIEAIHLGARRFPAEIVIVPDEKQEAVSFSAFTRTSLQKLSREELVTHLLETGLWPLIKQRPFSKIADPEAEPKAVFVNACHSAPFQADFSLILKGNEAAFQMGLDALDKLTEGVVHLCQSGGTQLPKFETVQTHTFSGPHPSGNTSVHINRISPILPHDTFYTLQAEDVILLGQLLLNGEYPESKVIALGGPAVKTSFRKHYRVPLAADLTPLFEQALESNEEIRVVAGHLLWGDVTSKNGAVRFYGSEFFALPEDRSRHFMGWTMPGLFQYSVHRLYPSVLLRKKEWKLGTNLHGGRRSMVVTGWYDKYQPLNIMTDFLIRAILAHDTDEAIQLGILETDPEDFALAAFIDPAKTDFCDIVKQGLEEIEKEGI